jgi:hypothetical protein
VFYNCNYLNRINFLGNPPTLGNNVFLNANANLKIYRYSTKSGWGNTLQGRDVLLIDSNPHPGFQTFGTLNLSLGQLKIISNKSSYQDINKISLIKTCGYQNINKLAQVEDSTAPRGAFYNFNHIALDYETFASNCTIIDLDPITILNSLGGVDFSSNYIIIRAKDGTRFNRDVISDLGNGIINITSPGQSFGLRRYWYRIFVMCRRGWNTVRLFEVDYPI